MNRASASAGTIPASASSRAASERSFRQDMNLLFPSELASPFVGGERLDHRIEGAVQNSVEGMQREPDAVVGHAVVLVVVRADLFGATAALHLRRARRTEFSGLAVLL